MESTESFVRATAPPDRLRKHITIILTIKLIALVAIWWYFFRADQHPPMNDAAVAKHVLLHTQSRN